MDNFRKESLKRQIQKQRGTYKYHLPDPDDGVTYLGKQIPNSNRSFRYTNPDEISLPIQGSKVG